MRYSSLLYFWLFGLTILLFIYIFVSHDKFSKDAAIGFDFLSSIKSSQKKDPGAVTVTVEELVRGPLAQNDSRIIEYIWKRKYLEAPSNLPYDLSEASRDPSMGQSIIVKHALNEMRGGFFVECGALDGETRSNTLMLEKDYGWKGLLIEADPKNYEKMLLKHRKAWTSRACLATKRFPHQVMFKQHFNMGKISNKMTVEDGAEIHGFAKVQCFPLFSLLSALNITTVDYFSLDVEGNELEVLRTIPFDALFIKVLSVEYVHDKGGRDAVKKFMTSKNFKVFAEVKEPHNFANDFIFTNSRIR